MNVASRFGSNPNRGLDLPAKALYALAAHDHRVRDAAARIHLRLGRAAEDIVAIGQDLISVKELLGHGNFLPWIKSEFGMSERSARNFMAVADRFGKSATVADFSPRILYALAAPSTPDDVVEEAAVRAEAGEKITADDVKAMKAKWKAERRKLVERAERAEMDAKVTGQSAHSINAEMQEVVAERDDLRQQRDRLADEAAANTVTATVVDDAAAEARPVIAALEQMSSAGRRLVLGHFAARGVGQ